MTERKEVQFVSIELPAPISTNRLWSPVVTRNGGPRMVKTTAYLNWLAHAGYKLNAQHPGKVPGPYTISIKAPKGCKLDLDNCIKATSDLLQAHHVIENDALAQRVTIERGSEETMSVMVVSTKGSE